MAAMDDLEALDYLDVLEELVRIRRSRQIYQRLVLDLEERVRPWLLHETDRNNALSPVDQILTALRYYATGAFQLAVGELKDVSQPTTSCCIRDVSIAIARLRSEYIFLPETEEERQHISQGFYDISGFPSCN